MLGGKSTALGLHVVTRQVAAEFLLDRVFDRQAMAVPARNVLRIEALELALLDNHVFEDLVHRMSHMDLSIGIRRAVVQDELRRASTCNPQSLVEAVVVPFPGPTRFALGQVTAHRKRCFRQVEGFAVVCFFCHGLVAAAIGVGGGENGLETKATGADR